MKQAGRKSALATVLAVLMMMAGGFSVSAAFAQGEDDPGQVEAGMAVFESNCAGCHGADGTGSDRGRPLTDIAAQGDRATHIASITDGIGNMPSFGDSLSAEEIEAAASYVRLTFVTQAEEEVVAEPDPVEELPNTGATTVPLAVGGIALLLGGVALVTFDLKRTARS